VKSWINSCCGQLHSLKPIIKPVFQWGTSALRVFTSTIIKSVGPDRRATCSGPSGKNCRACAGPALNALAVHPPASGAYSRQRHRSTRIMDSPEAGAGTGPPPHCMQRRRSAAPLPPAERAGRRHCVRINWLQDRDAATPGQPRRGGTAAEAGNAIQALFRWLPNSKFLHSLSITSILEHMHGAVNVYKKITNCTV
jgi:hypothetical protein